MKQIKAWPESKKEHWNFNEQLLFSIIPSRSPVLNKVSFILPLLIIGMFGWLQISKTMEVLSVSQLLIIVSSSLVACGALFIFVKLGKDCEEIILQNNKAFFKNNSQSKPLEDDIYNFKIQWVQLPGKERQLWIRINNQAFEIASSLNQEKKELLNEKINEAVKFYTAPKS